MRSHWLTQPAFLLGQIFLHLYGQLKNTRQGQRNGEVKEAVKKNCIQGQKVNKIKDMVNNVTEMVNNAKEIVNKVALMVNKINQMVTKVKEMVIKVKGMVNKVTEMVNKVKEMANKVKEMVNKVIDMMNKVIKIPAIDLIFVLKVKTFLMHHMVFRLFGFQTDI